ncbi:MAG: DUF952 domain-containing protein [Rhodospirillales bacterium]
MIADTDTPEPTIYHVCRSDEWAQALAAGVYRGSSQDKADGFIHFSAADQVRASVAKHRAGQDDLVILSVDPDALEPGTLKWESSRGGALFPHLYTPLPVIAVVRTDPLMLGDDGVHVFPADIGATERDGL